MSAPTPESKQTSLVPIRQDLATFTPSIDRQLLLLEPDPWGWQMVVLSRGEDMEAVAKYDEDEIWTNYNRFPALALAKAETGEIKADALYWVVMQGLYESVEDYYNELIVFLGECGFSNPRFS